MNEDPSKEGGYFRPREEDGHPQPPDTGSLSQTPQNHGWHSRQTLTIPQSDQRPVVVNAAQGALLHPLAHGHGGSRSVISLRSVNESSSALSHHPEDMPQNDSVANEARDAISYGGGFFPNAHDFNIQNANMNYYSGTEDVRRTDEEREARLGAAMEKLASEAMPSAMLDSKERAEAPRCNKDTRKTLRGLVVEWGRNLDGLQRLLWLFGPAAVGKSAVAQSVAEELKKDGYLGAVFFFSRPNNRSNPDVVIPTLVYQLALLLPSYQSIVTQLLIKDPLILTKSRQSQFTAFITDPFLTFLSQQPLTLLSEKLVSELHNRPLTVILDGLDECNNKDAQCEFVEMVSNHAKNDTNSRLRWMICSRPEPHIKSAFSEAMCRQEELEVDDEEAQEDARRILETGFLQIKKRYSYQLDCNWPDRGHIRVITERASGHLGFASFIIRFIGDSNYDNPSDQLDVCIRFLKGADRSHDNNPLHSLDLLYSHILSTIPRDILPTSQCVLGLLILYGDEPLTALVHANFLGLNQVAFYRSLQSLHSVISVPPPSEALAKSIQIHHASFSDFLKDPIRAKQFVLNEGEVHLDVAIRGLGWLKHWNTNPLAQEAPPELAWVPTSSDRQELLDSVCRFSFAHCWRAFPKVHKDSLSILKAALGKFDFNLDYSKGEAALGKFYFNFDYSKGEVALGFNPDYSKRDDRMNDIGDFLQWLLSSDAKSLARIDHWHAGLGVQLEKGEIAVLWCGSDPSAFVKPFLQVKNHADYYTIHLRLMTRTTTTLCLIVEHHRFQCWHRNIEHINQLREDDIIIAYMGHCNESVEAFIVALTNHYKSSVWATRVGKHPEYGSRLVLVRISALEDIRRTDWENLMLISEWLAKTYRKGIKLSGIIYLHPITNEATARTSLQSLQMLGSLCGDKAASRVMLVSTHWEDIDPAVGETREAKLKAGVWKGFLDNGSSIDRLSGEKTSRDIPYGGFDQKMFNKEDAWRVVKRLADTAQHRETLLLQEEIVDLQRNLNETEAGRTLRSYLPSLLAKQKDEIRSLYTSRDQMDDMRSFQTKLSRGKKKRAPEKREIMVTESEYERRQHLFKLTAKQAKELQVSKRRQTALRFSKNPRSRPIKISGFPDLQR